MAGADIGKTVADLLARAQQRAAIVESAVDKMLRAVETEADGETIKPGQSVTITWTVSELCAVCETLSGR